MSPILRRLAITLVLLCCGALPARAAENAALERGAAIIDPLALRELELGEHRTSALDRVGFGLRLFVFGARAGGDAPILNDELFALPSMIPVRKALNEEFERYITKHQADLPNETIGVGPSFDWQIFDRDLLYSARSRFVLAGIVNRMDRAYVAPETCGEIRLIYRLTRLNEGPVGETANSPRLPMTLNVVLRAKREKLVGPGDIAITCKDIAQRWLATADWAQTGVDLANRLMSPGGPLEFIEPIDVDRIETNLQIAHAPKSALRDFRTDYLMKVFDYNAKSGKFEEAPLENQIDRERLLADQSLKADFKAWLLEPKNFRELDRGTILIPEKFLVHGAIAVTPVGFAPSDLQPAFGLVQGEGKDEGNSPVFSDADVVAALKKAAEDGGGLQNIRSVAGFERRLNDMTCSGCHQTRGIGGFHFPGVDWMAAKPSNSTVVPASPHFFGDQVRRRDILTSLSWDQPPDYSRGFSSRPQLRRSTELAGTEYEDGWGAHCYLQHANAAENDKSFRSWTCAEGLACEAVNQSTRMGMCFVKAR
jgi:hypothetical protein